MLTKTLKAALAGALLISAAFELQAAPLKPFILAAKTQGDIPTVVAEVKSKLAAAGFEIVGAYTPYDGASLVVVTNEALKRNAAKSEHGGYGAAQRVAVTRVGDELQVSFTNPTYMANAYRMEGDLAGVTEKLGATLGNLEPFGPAQGLEPDDLRDYHYMLGMEYFDEPTVLNEFGSYNEAIETIEANLAKGVAGVSKVYRIDIPGKQESVFGVAMQAGKKGDKAMDDAFIMGEIDFKPLRSSAHLPYEILVSDNKAYALYARFRIAINFPDLSMMGEHSFMNIMSSPDAIANALKSVAGNAPELGI